MPFSNRTSIWPWLSPSHSFLSESLERREGCHSDRDAYSSKEGNVVVMEYFVK